MSDGVNLGTVNRLFLDKTAQQLRYFEVTRSNCTRTRSSI